MHPLPPAVWSRGKPYPIYREDVTRNHDVFDDAYATPAYTADDLALLARLPPLRVLAIAEDWCPDVFHTLPTWARLADELPGWELKVFSREGNPELMSSFVSHDDRRMIPVYAFYNGAGRLQAWWSGRTAAADAAIDRLLAGRPFIELDTGERAEVGRALGEAYRDELRRRAFEEIRALLTAFFHLDGSG